MKLFVYLILVVYPVCAQVENLNFSDIQPHIPEGLIPKEFANSSFSLEDLKNLIKSKCEKVAGSDAGYQRIEEGAMQLFQCFQSNVNLSSISDQIEEAKPKGTLDEVFTEYCDKKPIVVACVENFQKSLEPCLDKEEKDNNDIFVKIVKSLLNFVCYKGGDQIALFVAEKGPECFEQSREEVLSCASSKLSKYIPKSMSSADDLPRFIIGEKECRDFDLLQDCVVKSLEKCEEITPANIVESLFKFVRNETCSSHPVAAPISSSGSQQQPLMIAILLTIFGRVFLF